MAILKNTVQVNSGNTGWTRSNVLDALEETIADLGWNSGSQVNGVVTSLAHPQNSESVWGEHYQSGITTDWNHCGGPGITTRAQITHKYTVDDSGTAYVFQKFYPTAYVTTNTVTVYSSGLSVGDPLVWRVSSTNTVALGSVSDGDTVYVAENPSYPIAQYGWIQLAPTEADAIAGTNLFTFNTSAIDGNWRFYDPAHTDNTQLMSDINQGDTILFSSNDNFPSAKGGNSAITAHPLWFQDAAGAYDTTRTIESELNYVAISTSYRRFPNLDYGYVGGATDLSWDTLGWQHDQTFYIKSENDATYTVSFTLNISPGRTNNGAGYLENPYYDYTVPQDGSRSALNLRIYREDDTVPSKVAGIRVRDLNSTGWSESDTFTIPGTSVGGASPADDISVGVSTDESTPGASDGTASLHVTNFGAGVNAYVKNPARNQIIFRLENDATKTYGTTYQLIELSDDHTIKMNSGSSIDFLGSDITSSVSSRAGRWGGVVGLDWSTTYGADLATVNSAYTQVTEMDFATSSTPTAYPLKIVTYRAQSPQDTDFAIISFVQTINGVDTTYATWFYHKGNNYGSGIWDLDHVWQGGLTTIIPTTAQEYSIMFSTSGGHPRDGNHEREDAEGAVDERIMREAFYGYFRSPGTNDSYGFSQSYWSSNMWTNNDLNTDNGTVTPYFRHHEYDDVVHSNSQNEDYSIYSGNQNDYEAQKNKSMPAAANYYRPLKGLPIDVHLAPCPYYLPDDFVMIPFDISPGMASVRPGDTVTISGSEVYEVVRASYENNDETYDGITDNRTRGIIFAARTT